MLSNAELLAIYLAHRAELLSYANRFLSDFSRAEDVVQEAYVRFAMAADRKLLADPLSYLFRIVRNLALDTRRSADRERSRFVSDSDAGLAGAPRDAPSPEAEAVAREELRLLAEAMAELPESTRIALEMHRFGHHSVRQIAASLGVSVGTAHALIVNGLEHCRDRLRKRWH